MSICINDEYILITQLSYNTLHRTEGYLVAEVTDFCEQTYNPTKYKVNVGELINTVHEDAFNPGALLLVVIANPDTAYPNSKLLQVYSNGSQKLIAGTNTNAPRTENSFSWISAFYQLSKTSILIADAKLRCIRFVDITSGVTSPYSGECSQYSTLPSSTIKVKDGPVNKATFSQPNHLYQPRQMPNIILVVDRDRVREIKLDNQSIQTRLAYDQPITGIIKRENSYLLATSEDIKVYDEHWNFKEVLVGAWMTRLDTPIPETDSSNIPFATGTGTVIMNGKAKIRGYDFQMVDLGADMVMLYFDVDSCPWCSLERLPDDVKAVAVFSATEKSLIFMLYDGLTLNDVLSIYPKTMAHSINDNIYFSTTVASSNPTYCSLLKRLKIFGEYDFLLCHTIMICMRVSLNSSDLTR